VANVKGTQRLLIKNPDSGHGVSKTQQWLENTPSLCLEHAKSLAFRPSQTRNAGITDWAESTPCFPGHPVSKEFSPLRTFVNQ
jgi:hypothetical protein